jgi:hypothetical protein
MFGELTVYHSGMGWPVISVQFPRALRVSFAGQMARFLAGCLLTLAPVCSANTSGAELMKSIRDAGLDPNECYRVRDLSFARDEAQFFFTDGYLIFGRPIDGPGTSPVIAFFTTDVEGGEAEFLLLPPNRAERRSMARHTDTPNLEERLSEAVLVFADGTYRELMDQLRASPALKKSPEMGLLLTDKWSPVARNIGESFGLRLALDLMSPASTRKRFFAAAISGRKHGPFDVVFDPRLREPLVAGQSGAASFDIWTSFVSRSFRGVTFEPEFKLSNYRIETEIDADLKLHCITRVKVEPRQSGDMAFPFEISRRMQITGVTVDGESAEIVTNQSPRASIESPYGNDLFLVAPKHQLEKGRAYEFVIRHEGKVVSDAGHHVYFVGSRGTWYPSRGMQFARYDLTFRCARELDLVASGEPVEDRIDGNQRIVHRVTQGPIRLAGFNLGMYEKTRIQRGDLKIEVCANRGLENALQPKTPQPDTVTTISPGLRRPRPGINDSVTAFPQPVPRPTSHLQALASDVADAMEFYTTRFGPPASRSLEVSPVPGRFGQGFPGLIYLSTLSYVQPAGMDQHSQVFFNELLYAHEAAHQWWGNVVTSAGYHDDWVMESLANYSALMLLEKRKGIRALDTVLDEYRTRLLTKSPDGATIESGGPVIDGGRVDGDWNAVLYGKGTWIIHMLRRRMGDESFLKMLAALRRSFDDKSLSTDEFRAFCAGYLPPKSNDPKLESFFDQWVYGTGIPELKLQYSVKGAAPAWKVTGTVTQSGVDDDFMADVPVEVQLGKLKSVALEVRASGEPAPFSVSTKAPPSKVVIDRRSILSK